MKQLKYLFDEKISPVVIKHFRDKGFNCNSVDELMGGAKDTKIGEYAFQNRMIIVTLDKDFGHIYFNIGISVILLRLKNALPERIIFYLEKFFAEKSDVSEDELPKLFVVTEKKSEKDKTN